MRGRLGSAPVRPCPPCARSAVAGPPLRALRWPVPWCWWLGCAASSILACSPLAEPAPHGSTTAPQSAPSGVVSTSPPRPSTPPPTATPSDPAQTTERVIAAARAADSAPTEPYKAWPVAGVVPQRLGRVEAWAAQRTSCCDGAEHHCFVLPDAVACGPRGLERAAHALELGRDAAHLTDSEWLALLEFAQYRSILRGPEPAKGLPARVPAEVAAKVKAPAFERLPQGLRITYDYVVDPWATYGVLVGRALVTVATEGGIGRSDQTLFSASK